MAETQANNGLKCNFDVDYVVHYRFADLDPDAAAEELQSLIGALAAVGLETEVRHGDSSSLLIFVRAPEARLAKTLYTSKVKDWLYGVLNSAPESNEDGTAKPQTKGERLRTVFHMITSPKTEGGAGITPKHGEWKHVESVFTLHDKAMNKEWIKTWSQKTFLSSDDLDQIRNVLGEKVAFYFAFLQSYFAFLIFPTVFGISCWVLLGHFSVIYALVNSLWCIVFVEYWKRQEIDLGLRWQVRGVSAIRTRRREFRHEKEVQDTVTGEIVKVFPASKRLLRQLLQIPFALLATTALGVIIATCFGIEIFLSELYNGPLKSVLVFIPTVLLSALIPTISTLLTNVAKTLNDYENYETQDAYDIAMTQKIFVLNFITSYLPIFLTAFVYVPFGSIIVPYLDVFHLTVRPFVSKEKAKVSPSSEFRINPSRLRGQVFYFTVTAQVVNFAMETVVPYVKRAALRKYKAFSEEKAKQGNGDSGKRLMDDVPEEADFLARVRNEAELDEYDVTADLREMCIQFGYLSLFSPVWSLVPLSFLINNWIELRSDFVKICIDCRRPTPFRADSIGPWLDSLGFLAWLGSITSAALVYMFSNEGLGPDGTPAQLHLWALLASIFLAEHLYLLLRWAVGLAISQIESHSTRQERAEKYRLRQQYLGSSPSLRSASTESLGEEGEKIGRASLEEDARATSLHDASPADRFWTRQKGWKESVQMGKGAIYAQVPKSSAMEKKSQ